MRRAAGGGIGDVPAVRRDSHSGPTHPYASDTRGSHKLLTWLQRDRKARHRLRTCGGSWLQHPDRNRKARDGRQEHGSKTPQQRPSTERADALRGRQCIRRRRRESRTRVALQPGQIDLQVRRALIPQLAIFFQRPGDDALQLQGQFGIQTSCRKRSIVENRIEDGHRTVALKRQSAGRHFVHHHAEREQIAAPVDVLPERLLRRHVRDRAQRRPRARQIPLRWFHRWQLRRPYSSDSCALIHFGEPKVQNLGVSAIGHENVCRLDVPVHDPLRVGGVERVGNLRAQFQHRIDGQRLSADSMLQRLPFQKFHGQERLALSFLDVVNRADVRVVERRGGARFSLEPLQRLPVFCEVLRQKLQRHPSTQFRVFGLVDHTHAATTEFLDDAVVRNSLVDHGAPIGCSESAKVEAAKRENCENRVRCGRIVHVQGERCLLSRLLTKSRRHEDHEDLNFKTLRVPSCSSCLRD